MSLAIHGLIDHAATQAQRVDAIAAALEQLGARIDALHGEGATPIDLRRLSAVLEGSVAARDGGRSPS